MPQHFPRGGNEHWARYRRALDVASRARSTPGFLQTRPHNLADHLHETYHIVRKVKVGAGMGLDTPAPPKRCIR